MEIKTFITEEYSKPERTGRPSTVIPQLTLAVNNGEIFSIPVYTSAKTKVEGKGQMQADRIIKAMREINSKWTYAYHMGETLEIVLVPPRTKVPFATKSLVSE